MNTYLGFQCCIEIDNNLWFSSFRGKGLFCYDGKKVKHVLDFDEKGIKLFRDIKKYNKKLYFIPLTSTKIYIYDLENKHLESISYGLQETYGFEFSVIYKQYIYMFPSCFKGILRLDLYTNDIKIIDDWSNSEFEKYRISDDVYFRGDYVRDKDNIYVPFCNAHAILKFDLKDEKCTIYDVGNQGNATIVSDGTRYWMAPRKKGNILIWNPVTNEILEIRDFPEGFRQGGFIGSFYREGFIWMFPETANMVLKINVATGVIVRDLLFENVCGHRWTEQSLWYSFFIYSKERKGELLLCTGRSSEIIVFKPDKDEINCYRLYLSQEDSKYYSEEPDEKYIAFRDKIIKKGFFHENNNQYLEDYIGYFKVINNKRKSNKNYCSIGEIIYKDLSSLYV